MPHFMDFHSDLKLPKEAIDDIAKVAGISRPLAERIYKHLHEAASA